MKKNILYLIAILLMVSIGSCSLEEDPTYAYDYKNVFNSEETAQATITESYGYLASLYGKSILIPTIPNGTMVARVKVSEEASAAAYDIDPRGGNLATSYFTIAKMIDSSNRIIEGVTNSSALSEEFKEKALGDAYFIRGYAYYLLGSLWGRAPIKTKPNEGTPASINTPLSSRVDVYAQAEADWLKAVEKLPETSGIGWANKNVANAYLAKLYFMLASQKQAGLETSKYSSADELWNKVVEYGEKVKGKEYLEKDYSSLFGDDVSHSPEIIFQLNYASFEAKGIQKSWNSLFGPYFYTYFTGVVGSPDSYRTVVMDRAFYDYHAGSHPIDNRLKAIYLTDYMKEKYNDKDKDKRQVISYPYVLINESKKIINGRDFMEPGSDPKNPKYSFLEPGFNKKEVEKDPDLKALVGLWTGTGYGQGQFNLFPYSGKGSNKTSYGKFDTNNVILFRNADLLLILADAYNELGNEAKSNSYIQLVLDRATGTATHEPEKVPVMNQAERRDYIFFERMFELSGEPVVFEDIRRRGTEYLKKVIEIHNNSHFINYRYNLENEKNSKIDFRTIIINNKNLDETFLKKNLLLPIPQREITQNDNISQADQNFGYN